MERIYGCNFYYVSFELQDWERPIPPPLTSMIDSRRDYALQPDSLGHSSTSDFRREYDSLYKPSVCSKSLFKLVEEIILVTFFWGGEIFHGRFQNLQQGPPLMPMGFSDASRQSSYRNDNVGFSQVNNSYPLFFLSLSL